MLKNIFNKFVNKVNIFKRVKGLEQELQEQVFQSSINELKMIEARSNSLNESFQFGGDDGYDTDEAGWSVAGGDQGVSISLLNKYRKTSRNLCTYNPNAISIVRNFVKFVFGKGFVVQANINDNVTDLYTSTLEERFQRNQVKNPLPPGAPKRKLGSSYFKSKTEEPNSDLPTTNVQPELSPEEIKIQEDNQLLISSMNAGWMYFCKVNKLKKRWKETGNRFFRDGEAIIRWFEMPDTLVFRFVDPANLRGDTDYPEGIRTEENDVETVVSYFIANGNDDEPVEVPANEIQHIKNSDSDELRGWPILVPVMRRLRQYDTWIQDRISLNKIRASIALLRQHKGGAAQVGRFVDSLADRTDPFYGSNGTNSEIRRQRIHGGSLVDASKDTTYTFLEPNVQASDVRYDGRAILLSIAAGVGQPEYMVSADASNSNYSSTMVSESPGVREFEDWQDMFVGELESIWYRLRDYLIKKGILPQEAKKLTVSIQPSQLIARNRLQDTQSNTLLFENHILSPQEWSAREGLNYEQGMQDWVQHIRNYPEFRPEPYVPPEPKEQR